MDAGYPSTRALVLCETSLEGDLTLLGAFDEAVEEGGGAQSTFVCAQQFIFIYTLRSLCTCYTDEFCVTFFL
jgi:hypothetical protein